MSLDMRFGLKLSEICKEMCQQLEIVKYPKMTWKPSFVEVRTVLKSSDSQLSHENMKKDFQKLNFDTFMRQQLLSL